MFELPMLRVDKKEYLERLQAGEFFMRSSLYYQGLDYKDSARSDIFDGCIPAKVEDFPYSEFGISKPENSRLMIGNTFLKSFFIYKENDCHIIQENVYLLTISDDAKNALSNFSEEHVIMIMSPCELVEKVNNICEKESLKLWYSEVEYLDYKEMNKRKIEFLTGKSMKNPVFYKDVEFKYQQEFRFCIKYPYKNISIIKNKHGIDYQIISQNALYETHTINIGNISNISIIVPLSKILKYPVIVDMNEKKISFLNEEYYERNKR